MLIDDLAAGWDGPPTLRAPPPFPLSAAAALEAKRAREARRPTCLHCLGEAERSAVDRRLWWCRECCAYVAPDGTRTTSAAMLGEP